MGSEHQYTDEECMRIENEAMYSEIKRLRAARDKFVLEAQRLHADNERLQTALWEIVHHCDQRQEGGADKGAQWAADRAAAALAGKEGK